MHVQIPLWPGAAPDQLRVNGPESLSSDPKALVGGRSWMSISRVSRPTLTLYRPRGNNTGAAVLVYPGGGYWVLAIDLEGTEICDWLTAKGIACVLVKYRVHGDDGKISSRSGPYPDSPVALEDAQRAIALTRFHAGEWGIDPSKIGVLGFSAGGHLVAATSTLDRIYRPIDEIDRESVRPDFAIAIYPGHLAIAENSIALNPTIQSHITSQTPPTFLLQNEDDHVDSIEDSLSYYMGLKKAGVPVELHAYAQGGHAFGLRPLKLPVSGWPRLVEIWLGTIGMISE